MSAEDFHAIKGIQLAQVVLKYFSTQYAETHVKHHSEKNACNSINSSSRLCCLEISNVLMNFPNNDLEFQQVTSLLALEIFSAKVLTKHLIWKASDFSKARLGRLTFSLQNTPLFKRLVPTPGFIGKDGQTLAGAGGSSP